MPEAGLLTIIFFGFLLGIKHALDADHIVAITTIVSRSRSVLRGALAGLSWGMGHTLILFAAGFGVLVFKLSIPDRLALSVEFVVGILLVLLGVPLLKQLLANKSHVHLHQHEDKRHSHLHTHGDTPGHDHKHSRRPFLLGMVHGLAGSGVLIPLILSTMSSVIQGLLFIVIFGIGSMLGMLIFSGLISLPFKLTAGTSLRLNLWVRGIAGLISILLGFYIMWQIGFVDGLFSL